MTVQLSVAREAWPLAQAFTISRGSKTEAQVVTCTLSDGAHRGRGEAVPYARYGETTTSVLAQIESARNALERGAGRDALGEALPPGAARNALDCAFWDLEAKRSGIPVHVTAGLAAPRSFVTAYTISLGTPQVMGQAAEAARDRPLLKLKLGADDPVAAVSAVRRAAPRARLIADANEGWSPAQLFAIAPALAALGVELIEQPVPAAEAKALRGWDAPILICADESFHTVDDLPALAGLYGAVNIKLDKTGGLTGALQAFHAARASELKVMIGCMVATSLAMAPAALLAPFADYADLDGPLLLKSDRPGGFRFDGSVMHPAGPALWG